MTHLTRDELCSLQVPAGSVTIWWLGQAGFIFKSPAGKLVAIDPYLSNSCKAIGDANGFNFDRLVPPPLAPADLTAVDLYAMTHSHGDHLDPETLAGYRAAGGTGPYLAPAETAEKLQSLGVPAEQIVDDLAQQGPSRRRLAGARDLRHTARRRRPEPRRLPGGRRWRPDACT